MNRKIGLIGAALRTSWRYAVLAAVAPALLLTGGQAAARETVKLVQTITLPGQSITTFDISFVNTTLGIYLLADRGNATVDVFDTSSNQLIGQYSSASKPFAGQKSSNDLSGPDGVLTVADQEVWAGDGDSTIKVFDVFSGGLNTVINTGGKARADELCYDPKDGLVMMANDADDPPFVTIIDAKIGSPTQYKVLATIKMDGTGGSPVATNGIEQCVYTSGRFYVNIPEASGPGNDSKPGAVVVINPTTMKITANATIPLTACVGPQGLAVGPASKTFPGATDLILGCHDGPDSVIAVEGDGVAIVKTFTNESGDDEVAYNAADDSYYLASSSPTYTQFQHLGSIDAGTLTKDISTRTGIVSGFLGVSHQSNHSVAADDQNDFVYVPIGATSGSTYCPTANGCIGVFRSQGP